MIKMKIKIPSIPTEEDISNGIEMIKDILNFF